MKRTKTPSEIKRQFINKVAIAVITCVVLIFTTLFLLANGEKNGQPYPDCPELLRGHTALFIDQTDPLSTHTFLTLNSTTTKLFENAIDGDMISIYSIDEHSDANLKPIYSGCRPAKKSEFKTNKKIEIKKINKFLKNAQEISSTISGRDTSSYSPIIETINEFLNSPSFDKKIPKRELYIFSDMLQNTPTCSDYPNINKSDNYLNSCPKSTEMGNVKVNIYYALRKGYLNLQNDLHREKWEKHFVTAGATVSLNFTRFDQH